MPKKARTRCFNSVSKYRQERRAKTAGETNKAARGNDSDEAFSEELGGGEAPSTPETEKSPSVPTIPTSTDHTYAAEAGRRQEAAENLHFDHNYAALTKETLEKSQEEDVSHEDQSMPSEALLEDSNVIFDGIYTLNENCPAADRESEYPMEDGKKSIELNGQEEEEILISLEKSLNCGKLPPFWKAEAAAPGLHILKYSYGEARVVQRSLYWTPGGLLKIFVHGKELPSDHFFLEHLQNLEFSNLSVKNVCETLISLVSKLRSHEICVGVTKLKYKSFWHGDDCVIDNNPFLEMRYQLTCRSKECLKIVPTRNFLCISCSKLAKKFADRPKPLTPRSKSTQKTPNKFKPYAACTSEEKKKRTARYQKDIQNLRKRNARLSLKQLIEDEGVEVDAELDEDFSVILQEESKRRAEANDNSEDANDFDFQKFFIEQQLEARKKGPHGIRWHPLMIRFAIQLQMATQSKYSDIADSKFILLPSARTLFDYTHVMDSQEGCHLGIINDVAEDVAKMEHSYQAYHVLTFDEVSISEGVVQKKETGQVVGYCKLTEVQEEFSKLQQVVMSKASGTSLAATTPSVPIAKKMLCYLVKGVASGVESVIACYGVSTLSKEDLHDYTWEVVEKCETSGIKILAFVADGSPVNRGFFDMLSPYTELKSGIIFDTLNPYDPSRRIFILSDPPHLIKTIRNCFSKSGRLKNRKLKKNGQEILWKTIVRLYKMKAEQTIKKLHKLDASCVYLNSFSCMKVRTAARVLSRSVANALKMLKWENMEETILFN